MATSLESLTEGWVHYLPNALYCNLLLRVLSIWPRASPAPFILILRRTCLIISRLVACFSPSAQNLAIITSCPSGHACLSEHPAISFRPRTTAQAPDVVTLCFCFSFSCAWVLSHRYAWHQHTHGPVPSLGLARARSQPPRVRYAVRGRRDTNRAGESGKFGEPSHGSDIPISCRCALDPPPRMKEALEPDARVADCLCAGTLRDGRLPVAVRRMLRERGEAS
ncbi:hypothetical protein FA95DRAFT_901877 [Auriscalpium vulgare]|uniref:Uncharacterized protein n=1 Tax=Auriscalpium vulgare TaxID=40419 RepID=A0ACB8R8P7_9AGAM|nr:hypothetical protein FA95DRAFT_901877 [Auriscalpium vulgare]